MGSTIAESIQVICNAIQFDQTHLRDYSIKLETDRSGSRWNNHLFLNHRRNIADLLLRFS